MANKDNPAQPVQEPADVVQMRAELAMLRSIVHDELDRRNLKEKDEKEKALFLAWVNLTTEEKTQLAADAKFKGLAGHTWEVQLPEHPKVRVPGHSEYEAIGRYNEICGIISTDKQYTATDLNAPPPAKKPVAAAA